MRRRVEVIIRWALAYLLAACLFVLLSLLFAPFSPVYMGAAGAAGLAYTILTLLCWKVEKYQPLHWLVFIPAILLVVEGRYWAERSAFPEARYDFLGWWSAIQYICTVFAVFFAALFLFRVPIKKIPFRQRYFIGLT